MDKAFPSSDELRQRAKDAEAAAKAVEEANAADARSNTASQVAANAAAEAEAAKAAARAAVGVASPAPPPPLAPVLPTLPPGQPPNPPVPPSAPALPPNPSGGGAHASGWVGFAVGVAAFLVALVLGVTAIVLQNGKASEGFVQALHASAQSAIASLRGTVDKAVADTATNTAAITAVKDDVANNVKPAVKRAQDTADTALSASASCTTCPSNGSASGTSGGRSGGNTGTPPRKTADAGQVRAPSRQTSTPVVTMNQAKREIRTDGRCVLELIEPNGAKAYVRLDTAKANGNLTAAKVDNKIGEWNRSNFLSYVGDGRQTVRLDGNSSCQAAIAALTSSRAFPWTSTRIGVNGCTPNGQV